MKAFYDPAKLKQLNPHLENKQIDCDPNLSGHVAFLKQKLVDDTIRDISVLHKESSVSRSI